MTATYFETDVIAVRDAIVRGRYRAAVRRACVAIVCDAGVPADDAARMGAMRLARLACAARGGVRLPAAP